MYTGSKSPAAAIGDINRDMLGTANAAITGNPPLPIPTKTDARTAKHQKIRLFSIFPAPRNRAEVSHIYVLVYYS